LKDVNVGADRLDLGGALPYRTSRTVPVPDEDDVRRRGRRTGAT